MTEKNKEIEWTPNDYSPTYVFEVDADGNYVKLNKLFSMETHWPESKEMEIEQHYRDYMAGDGFKKYKEWREWLTTPKKAGTND